MKEIHTTSPINMLIGDRRLGAPLIPHRAGNLINGLVNIMSHLPLYMSLQYSENPLETLRLECNLDERVHTSTRPARI